MSKLLPISTLKVICENYSARTKNSLNLLGFLSKEKKLENFLQTNKMADQNETVFDVFQRATKFIAEAGVKFRGTKQAQNDYHCFLQHVSKFEIILGSPILTNAGRRTNKSISACSIPPIHLSKMTKDNIAKMINNYHTRGMGTGFSLDDVNDPVEMVTYLNQIAILEIQQGKIERSVGNMGVLSINHPKIIEFISIKKNHPEIKEWKFNLSVNLTTNFIDSLSKNIPFEFSNGKFVDPKELMHILADSAHKTGDPGLIFMDRINKLNRVPQMGIYKTVVPCGEVSLFDGEVCQFSYLNLISFIEDGKINKENLKETIYNSILLLDNVVEANIESMPTEQSKKIISSLRRIGIGICGFAELLQSLHIPYDSEEARKLAANLMSFINYHSKLASVFLAKERGAFDAFDNVLTRKELFIDPFSNLETDYVSKREWQQLKMLFDSYKIRNLSTTILPPSGRSSILAGVTGSIEPPFKLIANDFLKETVKKIYEKTGSALPSEVDFETIKKTGSAKNTFWLDAVKDVFKTAVEISPKDHILMTATFQKYIDEGISKTVNLPNNYTVKQVEEIFIMAHELNLKGITIYRDGCREFQPKELGSSKDEKTMTITINDHIYGIFQISEKINKLLNSPMLQRLKKIHQNGVAYLIHPSQSTTRYEHSVGVMLLTKFLGGNEEDQIKALLHDVSHTTFSHLIDQVYMNQNQNYHEVIKETFLSSKSILTSLKEIDISINDLSMTNDTIFKGIGLNADRIDYCLRDLKAMNRIFQPEYSAILNNLIIDDSKKIHCTDLKSAKFIFNKFIEVNQEIYFDSKVEVAQIVMKFILNNMIKKGLLLEKDFLSTDEEILRKIIDSEYKSYFLAISSELEFKLSHSPTKHFVTRKLRFIDPTIIGKSGKLTDYCKISKNKLESYLKTPTIIYYNIPLLEKDDL